MNPSTLRLDSSAIYAAAIPPPYRSGTQGCRFLPLQLRKMAAPGFSLTVCSAKQTSAVVESGEATESRLSRIESLSQVSGVLGCQWGDEGKGKLVDVLAKHFDVVARCQVRFCRLCDISSTGAVYEAFIEYCVMLIIVPFIVFEVDGLSEIYGIQSFISHV